MLNQMQAALRTKELIFDGLSQFYFWSVDMGEIVK